MKRLLLIFFLLLLSITVINSNEIENEMIEAIKKDKYFLVNKLLKKGADVNYKNKEGKTPLIIAVINNNYDIVELLLIENNANYNEKDENEKTALDYAYLSDNNDILLLLKQFEIKDIISKIDNFNLTASFNGFNKELLYNNKPIKIQNNYFGKNNNIDCNIIININDIEYKGEIHGTKSTEFMEREKFFLDLDITGNNKNLKGKINRVYHEFDEGLLYTDKFDLIYDNNVIKGKIQKTYYPQNTIVELTYGNKKINGYYLYDGYNNTYYIQIKFGEKILIGKIFQGFEYDMKIYTDGNIDEIFLYLLFDVYKSPIDVLKDMGKIKK